MKNTIELKVTGIPIIRKLSRAIEPLNQLDEHELDEVLSMLRAAGPTARIVADAIVQLGRISDDLLNEQLGEAGERGAAAGAAFKKDLINNGADS